MKKVVRPSSNCLKAFVIALLVTCISLVIIISKNSQTSGIYELLTSENRKCSDEIDATVFPGRKRNEVKENIYNSVLEERKLLNNWVREDLDYYLQPWIDKKQEKPEKKPDDEKQIKRFPKVICLGVRKCGTSAFQTFLTAHPKVVSSGSEIHFFDSSSYLGGSPRYLSMLPRSTADQIVIDKSPRYFFAPFVPSRIWEWNRNVKLIVVVCDPVPRTFSDYVFDKGNRARLRKEFKSFDDLITTSISDIQAIKEDPLGTLGYPTFHSFVRNMYNERTYQLGILTHGLYAIHLIDFYTLFNKNQIHIVDGEELIRDPASVMKKTQAFLEIEQFLTKDSFYFDTKKGFFCLVGKPCLNSHKGATRKEGTPTMSMETREKLRRFYKPYNEELFKMLNRTFENWL